jgi:hypothetical protein
VTIDWAQHCRSPACQVGAAVGAPKAARVMDAGLSGHRTRSCTAGQTCLTFTSSRGSTPRGGRPRGRLSRGREFRPIRKGRTLAKRRSWASHPLSSSRSRVLGMWCWPSRSAAAGQ